MKHCIALALLSIGLAACARSPTSALSTQTPAADVSSPPAAAPATAPASTSAPVSPGDLTAAATTQQESADTGTSTDRGDTSLERIAALPARDQLPVTKWVAGTNYQVLSPAQPTNAPPGTVEVIEVFWYGCPHCYALDPYLQSWLKTKAAYIDFVRVPVMWGEIQRAHAQLFYTLQALGKLDALHSAVFDEIHQKGDELYVQGNASATLAKQVAFAQANGISASAFTNAFNSFGVQSALQKADDLGRRYAIDSVPTVIIDGKYKSDVDMAKGDSQLIEVINDLAASAKRPPS